MEGKKTYIEIILNSFEQFVCFMQKKWTMALMTTFFLIFVAAVSLGMYFIYQIITKNLSLLEATHSTPDSLQVGLVNSVTENLLIEKELAKIILKSKNGVSAVFFKFHDSKTDLQGKHDFYYSGMNEVSKISSITFLPSTQSVPITSLGSFMIPFIENRCQTIKTLDINDNNWLRTRLDGQSVIRISTCPIFDISDKYLIGFVELIYLKPNDQVRLPGVVENDLEIAAKNISAIISSEIKDNKQ